MPSVQTGGFRILKNRSALPTSVIAAIQSVRVEDEINIPTMFSFTLNIVSSGGAWQDVNLDIFKPGDEITVFLGLDSLQQMVSAEITAIEPHFSDYSTATIRGFDRMYWLKFGTRTRTYLNLDDNEIVSQVARAAGLTVKLPGSPAMVNDYVLQNNSSDYDFLMRRCAQLNYELLMDDTTLVFRPSAEGESPVKTMNYPTDISDLKLSLKLPTMGKQVTVKGYDITSNKVLTAVASSGSSQDKMGGKESGYQLAQAFPDSDIQLERPDLSTPEALQAIANAQYKRNLNQFIEGSTSVLGDPDMVAGVNVKLSGLSQRFNGIYYITSSVHSYDVNEGYQTEFKLRRTGV
ncbi:phage late control gene D family protein [Collimonas fungivorans]|uniref:Phage late control gene D family protein n=1 Tax=Collimonas fungivorans TaxID=158899 RepID=A0A127PBH1_9BURK|nr:contractile injection system protein, VgrG/Pvc8 family [Collimonas fungivorans]AMO95179.1 phage late control gene D family protein [Collimonas fungivorans]